MMLELAREVAMPTQVELLLADLLDREWVDQSGRAAPLQATSAVRELVELVLAQTRWGIHAWADIDWAADTPDELVAALRDVLPAELSPWRTRMARRAAALREGPPLLPAGAAQPQLPAAPEPEVLLGPATGAAMELGHDPPAPAPKPSPKPVRAVQAAPETPPLPITAPTPEPPAAPASDAVPAPSPWRAPKLRIVVLAVCCVLLGAAIGALDGGLSATDFLLGAVAGFAAATLAAFSADRS